MSETPFYKTRMGQRFYERTMPDLVRQLERLREILEEYVQCSTCASRTTDAKEEGEPPRS